MLDDNGPHELKPRMFAAFPAGEGNGHHIQNRSDRPGIFLIVGSRRLGSQ
ncbi:hypothetical protein HFO29_04930 [Rhizobium laguerreae]|nr:hypothetical protein [Rhizobium laguerreae]